MNKIAEYCIHLARDHINTKVPETEAVIHRNTNNTNIISLNPQFMSGCTPEPLNQVQSKPLPEPLIMYSSLEDNHDTYVVYDRTLKLEPFCGSTYDDHTYSTSYHPKVPERSSVCSKCFSDIYASNRPSAKCLNCDIQLCLECYSQM